MDYKIMSGACIGVFCVLGFDRTGYAQAADPPSDAGAQLEEILVTAQRRSERLQDVPATVEAFSGQQLTTAGVDSVADLKLVVPGLQVGNGIGSATVHLRGIGSTAFGPGIENPVAVYVDGVYYAAANSVLFDFIDVQDVQVLKGPQGTLFGRNATGGLIQVTTREPTQAAQVDASLTYGNFNTVKAALYAGGGIAADLAADVAVQIAHQGDGYGTNFFNGEDVNRDDLSANARSKWVWTPATATKVTAVLDFSQQKNSLIAQRVAFGDQNLPFLVGEPPPSGTAWDVRENVQPLFFVQNGGASFRLDQDLSFAHLMDIVAFRQSASHSDFDLDSTSAPFEGIYFRTNENQLSEEIQLSSASPDKVHWVGGFYYFKSNSKYDPSHVTFDPDPALSPGFASVSVFGDQGARSLAPYGQATVTVLPETDLTIGARYTDETHDIFGSQSLYLADGSTLATIPFPGLEKKFSKFTYRIALDHRFSDSMKAYASYSTGFKSGGFNTQTPSDPAYEPETIEATEVGIKSDLFKRRLQIDIAAFHYVYSQIQVQKIEASATGIINGASALINGVDLDLEARVTEHFSINSSLEYLNAKFTSFPDAPIGPPMGVPPEPVTFGSATGNALPFAPRFAVTVGGNYEIDLPDSSKVNLNVTSSSSSRYAAEPDNITQQASYTKFNAAVRWSSSDDRYDVSLWGRNLSDRATVEYGATLPNGLRNALYAPPRTYGVSFDYHMR